MSLKLEYQIYERMTNELPKLGFLFKQYLFLIFFFSFFVENLDFFHLFASTKLSSKLYLDSDLRKSFMKNENLKIFCFK